MDRPSVLVTGGARRIGASIATAFGGKGWHVVIHYGRSRNEAQRLADTLTSAEIVQCDLTDVDAALAMIASLAGRLDDWRMLINSASVFEPDSVTALDPATYNRAMTINAHTPVRMGQAYLASARSATGRRLVQITDQKLANPNPDFFSYTLSKHALAASVPMMAMAAIDARDRVYALAPGAILPSHDQDASEIETSHRLNVLNRKTDASEIAETCLFLATGTLASGETVFVDSGQHLLRQPRDVIYLAR